MAYKKNYTPEEKAAYNEKKKAEMEALIKRIDEGVKGVFESDRYKEYLKFVSKFTDYSARNTMLINMQRPDATLVAAYGKWKQLGRQVERGQTGIEILAPVAFKTNQIMETERPAKDEFGNQLYNPDGTEKMETVENPVTELGFKKVYVFDVSQTSGKELPEPVQELTGEIDTARKESVFAALKKVTGIDIEFQNIKGGAKGYYSPVDNRIVIQSGMSDAQTLKTAFHEAAHNLLHDPSKNIVTVKSARNEKEVQAESVAFIVAEKFGLDTSEYSFPYIASWSDGKQLEQLKNSLQEIQSAAKKISTQIESELMKMQKRHLSMDEKLEDTELNNIQKAEFLIEDCAGRGVHFSKEDTDKILDFAGNHENVSDTVQLVTDMEEIQKQRDSYGYDFTYMTPIDTKEEALAAFDRGEAVYLLYPDNTEGMAESRSEIENFEGYFGIEKEPSRDVAREQNSELIPVSKEIALEMWDKDLDVYIDGVRAEKREAIENAPLTAKLYLSEFQYAAQLDFEKSQNSNVKKTDEQMKAKLLAYNVHVSKVMSKTPENIAADIDKAISDSNYELYRYNLKQAAATVIKEHGAEAVSRTLAEYIARHDYDGRISAKNKEWAKTFDIPENKYAPVLRTHPTVIDGFISEACSQMKELEQAKNAEPNLPEMYQDKFLLPQERVEQSDDHRGIPETNFYMSPVNEWFVQGIGWLDNAVYNRERKMSELNANDFYNKVDSVNATYVDTEGRTGQIDMSKHDYEQLTAKTYALENRQAYEAAKEKLEERRREAGIAEKPTEYYAVRQMSDRKFAVCSLSADGLVTVVKPNITTVAEAKKVMLEIYNAKKDTVKCELIHPQTLDEKSTEIYREQTKELPDVTYRIKVNHNKNAEHTHILQEYIKNADDTYAVGKVIARGDYEKCNKALAAALNPEKTQERTQTFEIYQIKGGDETRDYRFESYAMLQKHGLKPDFKNYDKVYTGDVSILPANSGTIGAKLEAIFEKFNIDHPVDFKGHSLSVSDVVVMDDKAYYVDSFGFKPLEEFLPLEQRKDKFLSELPGRLQDISEGKTEHSTDQLTDEALKLKVSPAIIREASHMFDDDKIDRMADTYEQAFRFGNTSLSELNKPKTPKKVKL